MTFLPEFRADKSLYFMRYKVPHLSGGFIIIPCMSDLVK